MTARPVRHGTITGYNKHIRLREELCDACRAAGEDWRRARYLRMKSGLRVSMQEALAELGLPPNRVPS